MAKNIELLLLRSVENLGIVGDIVRVKPGFARNYLLPHGLAETPTASKIESLREERALAQADLSRLRDAREELLARMTEVTVTLVRSCNDKGILYGSVTQRDIADALVAAGYGVDVKAVRLSNPFRRVGSYPVPIQFEKDLSAEITLQIDPDRELNLDEPEPVEDEEGSQQQAPKAETEDQPAEA